MVHDQLARHGIAHNVKLPIIVILVARCAAQSARFRFVAARQSAHELRRAIDNLVAIQVQLKGIPFVFGDLIEHMLVVARRARNRALRLPFPGSEDRFVGRPKAGNHPTNKNNDEQRAAHEDDRIILEVGSDDQPMLGNMVLPPRDKSSWIAGKLPGTSSRHSNHQLRREKNRLFRFGGVRILRWVLVGTVESPRLRALA